MRINPFIETVLEFKDGKEINGFLRIQSPTDLKFKDSLNQKNSLKIDYKSIKTITTFTNDRYHNYEYKKTDRDKFLKFVELLYSSKNNKVELYIYSPNIPSLFYQGVDRSNVRDYINGVRNPRITLNNINRTITLPESPEALRSRLSSVLAPKYLFGIKGEEKLYDVFSKKRLLKFAEKHLNTCPIILKKIANKTLKSEDAPEILEEYQNCKN